MGKNSKISWCDHSWNPWVGCSKVSIGCENCYMFRDQKRFGNDPQEIRRTKKRTFQSPIRWKEPSKIFVCSWSDFFHPDVPEDWRRNAMYIMYLSSQHTFLLLTKRPENIKEIIHDDWWRFCPNVWLGVTAENQEMADERIPLLLEIPAVIKFVSAEPLLGSIDFCDSLLGIDWVIVGGESGPGNRHMRPGWVRSIKDQCKRFTTPFFMKQMSGNTKKKREAIPDDLQIREFPTINEF